MQNYGGGQIIEPSIVFVETRNINVLYHNSIEVVVHNLKLKHKERFVKIINNLKQGDSFPLKISMFSDKEKVLLAKITPINPYFTEIKQGKTIEEMQTNRVVKQKHTDLKLFTQVAGRFVKGKAVWDEAELNYQFYYREYIIVLSNWNMGLNTQLKHYLSVQETEYSNSFLVKIDRYDLEERILFGHIPEENTFYDFAIDNMEKREPYEVKEKEINAKHKMAMEAMIGNIVPVDIVWNKEKTNYTIQYNHYMIGTMGLKINALKKLNALIFEKRSLSNFTVRLLHYDYRGQIFQAEIPESNDYIKQIKAEIAKEHSEKEMLHSQKKREGSTIQCI